MGTACSSSWQVQFVGDCARRSVAENKGVENAEDRHGITRNQIVFLVGQLQIPLSVYDMAMPCLPPTHSVKKYGERSAALMQKYCLKGVSQKKKNFGLVLYRNLSWALR